MMGACFKENIVEAVFLYSPTNWGLQLSWSADD